MTKKITSAALDCGAIVGLAIFVFGLWLAWRPLAAIVGGPLLAAVCVFLAYRRDRKPEAVNQ